MKRVLVPVIFMLIFTIFSLFILSRGSLVKGESLMYEGSEFFSLEISKGGSIAYQFNTSDDFNKLEVHIANVSRTGNKSFTAYLYKWDHNYKQTTKSKPVYQMLVSELYKNQYVSLDTGTQKAGQYLLVLADIVGKVTFDISRTNLKETQIYTNTSELAGSMQVKITYTGGRGSLKDISANVRDYNDTADTWEYIDGLGRTNPDDTRAKRDDKFVGIFYHTWHADHYQHPNRNITEILKERPELVNDYDNSYWPTYHTNYFWNEPLFGYYNNGVDRWLLRRHAELLADAGVDVVIFDQTNGTQTFIDAILNLLEVFAEAKNDGVKAPAITAMLPMFDYGQASTQLREMYNVIYSKGLFEDLWFKWEGKPLMLSWPGQLDESDPVDAAIAEFFTYRPINPSYTVDDAQTLNPDGSIGIKWSPPAGVRDYINWKWISIYPQAVAYRSDGSPEQMCVCIAQNWAKDRGLAAMNGGDLVFGRSYSDEFGYDLSEEGKLYGANFKEQWEYALKVDPDFVYITGWNEWVAGRFKEFHGTENAFPDNFSDNYSRDIEPSAGDLKDHYYYQMVYYIRQYKGTSKYQESSGMLSIDINSKEDMWKDVEPKFIAYEGNTFDRNINGYLGHKYVNETGRNDISYAKVSYDKDFIYFMVETAQALTDKNDKAWMRLYIDTGESDKNWESFEYVINRVNPQDKATLERSTGGFNWEKLADLDYSIKGNRLEIRVAKKDLGISGDNFTFSFKWADNTQVDGDILDFYQSGDTAPLGRFKYKFTSKEYTDSLRSKKFTPYIIGGLALVLVGLVSGLGVFMIKKKKRV